jgi:hypothetical protein
VADMIFYFLRHLKDLLISYPTKAKKERKAFLKWRKEKFSHLSLLIPFSFIVKQGGE